MGQVNVDNQTYQYSCEKFSIRRLFGRVDRRAIVFISREYLWKEHRGKVRRAIRQAEQLKDFSVVWHFPPDPREATFR